MLAIEARNLFTSMVAASFSDIILPTMYLASFSTEVITTVKTISVVVRRENEYIAIDVVRGTKGDVNNKGRTTERHYEPPMYSELIILNQESFYDRLFLVADNSFISRDQVAQWSQEVVDLMVSNRNKVIRTIEVKWSEIFSTGISTFTNNEAIDFKRKAASIVTVAASKKWTATGAKPLDDLAKGASFLRKTGKSIGNEITTILSLSAYNALVQSKQVTDLAIAYNVWEQAFADTISGSSGETYHSTITWSGKRFRLVTYDQYYDIPGGVKGNSYIKDGECILIGANPHFITAYAGVQMVRGEQIVSHDGGKTYLKQIISEDQSTDIYEQKAAIVCVPTSIDLMYTLKGLV